MLKKKTYRLLFRWPKPSSFTFSLFPLILFDELLLSLNFQSPAEQTPSPKFKHTRTQSSRDPQNALTETDGISDGRRNDSPSEIPSGILNSVGTRQLFRRTLWYFPTSIIRVAFSVGDWLRFCIRFTWPCMDSTFHRSYSLPSLTQPK